MGLGWKATFCDTCRSVQLSGPLFPAPRRQSLLALPSVVPRPSLKEVMGEHSPTICGTACAEKINDQSLMWELLVQSPPLPVPWGCSWRCWEGGRGPGCAGSITAACRTPDGGPEMNTVVAFAGQGNLVWVECPDSTVSWLTLMALEGFTKQIPWDTLGQFLGEEVIQSH